MTNRSKLLLFTVHCSLFTVPPLLASAQVTDMASLFQMLAQVINKLYVFLLSLALVVFLWGLALFIKNAGDAKTHEQGRSLMLWGIICFFVLVTLWAIVYFIAKGSLGLQTETPCYTDKGGNPVGGAGCTVR